MRPDMKKLIVERGRYGSKDRSQKYGLRVRDEEYEPKPFRPKRTKSFSETLNPMGRYLERNVGRPWDKVYSEIRANLDMRSATGLHIMQHLYQYVERHCWMDGKTVMRFVDWRRRSAPVEGLYVHPKTGILRRAPRRPRRSPPQLNNAVRMSDHVVCEITDGVWFRYEYGCHDLDAVVEVVRFHDDQPARNGKYGLREPGDRRVIRYRDVHPARRRYLVSKRQCTQVEVEEIEARINF